MEQETPHPHRSSSTQTQMQIHHPPPFPVLVHRFPSPLDPPTYSCAYERGSPSSKHALVYIGGLTSGPHTSVDVPQTVLQALEDGGLDYSIWEVRTRGSYSGWGFSSLASEAEEVAGLVRYLRDKGRERVVLMGSSSGE